MLSLHEVLYLSANQAPVGVPLGTTAFNVAVLDSPSFPAIDQYLKSVRYRWYLKSISRSVLSFGGEFDHRANFCMRSALPNVQFVKGYKLPNGHGTLKNLLVCKVFAACPVCAGFISDKRKAQLEQLIAAAKLRGLRPLLVTFTFSHHSDEPLAMLLDALLGCYRAMWQDWAVRQAVKSVRLFGWVRSLESTWGPFNGWHPHLHVLMFVPDGVDVSAFSTVLTTRWLAVLARRGRSADALRGVRVDLADERIGAYVAKYGEHSNWSEAAEVAKGPVKRGRGFHYSLWQLLERAEEGDRESARRWLENVRAMHRRRGWESSRGLFLALLSEDDKPDEELLDEEDVGAVLRTLIRAGAFRDISDADIISELTIALGSGSDADLALLFDGCGLQPGRDYTIVSPKLE